MLQFLRTNAQFCPQTFDLGLEGMVRPLPLGFFESLVQLDSFRLAHRQRSERLLLYMRISIDQLDWTSENGEGGYTHMFIFEARELRGELVVQDLERFLVVHDPRLFVPDRVEVAVRVIKLGYQLDQGRATSARKDKTHSASSSSSLLFAAASSASISSSRISTGRTLLITYRHVLPCQDQIRMGRKEREHGRTRLLNRVHQFALDPFVEFLDPGNVLLFLR